MRTLSGIRPLYVGLAGRSLRQRLKGHLKSVRMQESLRNSRPRKRLYYFAELDPNTDESVGEYLGPIERALILSAVRAGGGQLNTHQRIDRPPPGLGTCVLLNTGHRQAWSDWAPTKMTVELLPARRPRGIAITCRVVHLDLRRGGKQGSLRIFRLGIAFGAARRITVG